MKTNNNFCLDFLDSQLKKFKQEMPGSLKYDFEDYLNKKKQTGTSSAVMALSKEPIWIKLLSVLHNHFCTQKNSSEFDFTQQIICGQAWLVMAFRIKDDLFDDEIKTSNLSIVADLFYTEFYKIFLNNDKLRNSFWNICFYSIQSSIYAAFNIDELQKNLATNPDKVLTKYFDLSQLFNIGIIAFFEHFNLTKNRSEITELQIILLVISQILDDIEDIIQDYKKGRYNFALLEIINTDDKNDNINSTLTYNDLNRLCLKHGFKNIFKKIYLLIIKAQYLAKRINIYSLMELVDDFQIQILEIENSLHQYRTRLFFNNLVGNNIK